MRYENVVQGRFLSRPNRFIALVELDGDRDGLPCEEHRTLSGTAGAGG